MTSSFNLYDDGNVAENLRKEYYKLIESLQSAYALIGTNLKTHSKC